MVCQKENANHNISGWFQDHNVRMVDAPLPISAITQELRRAGASVVQGSPVHFHCQVETCFFPLFEQLKHVWLPWCTNRLQPVCFSCGCLPLNWLILVWNYGRQGGWHRQRVCRSRRGNLTLGGHSLGYCGGSSSCASKRLRVHWWHYIGLARGER